MILLRNTTKINPQKRCGQTAEQRKQQLIREFKREARERGSCECRSCWKWRTLASMMRIDAVCVDGWPVGCWAICNRCWLAARRSGMQPFQIIALVEAAARHDYLEMWG